MKHLSTLVVIVANMILLSACESETTDAAAADPLTTGMKLYMLPHDDGNSFSCASCHALSEPQDSGVVTPGHPIGNAFYRETFKNGY